MSNEASTWEPKKADAETVTGAPPPPSYEDSAERRVACGDIVRRCLRAGKDLLLESPSYPHGRPAHELHLEPEEWRMMKEAMSQQSFPGTINPGDWFDITLYNKQCNDTPFRAVANPMVPRGEFVHCLVSPSATMSVRWVEPAK